MPQRSIRRYLRQGMMPQLSVFEAVARHGNFTKAGEELFMAQPTVSVQMKKLTETLGVSLVEQLGKQIHLTPAGRILYDSCHEIFASLTRLDSEISRLSTLTQGYLHLAASSAAEPMLPRLLAGFAKAYPNIRISLQFCNRQALLARLRDNQDDLYIFDLPPGGDCSGFVTQYIGANRLYAYAAAEHPLAAQRNIPWAVLAAEPYISREPGSATRLSAANAFLARELVPQVIMELGSNDAIREAVRSGLGVSILPEHPHLPMNGLVRLDVQGLPLEESWNFVYPVGKSLPASAERFMAYVREQRQRATENLAA